MGNQRPSFAKRQREADLKDKARAKRERRAAKAEETPGTKGPEIAWDEAVRYVESPMPPVVTPDPDDNSGAGSPSGPSSSGSSSSGSSSSGSSSSGSSSSGSGPTNP